MKSIITWNVNGIRAIQKKGFIEWLKHENPDILCIQETKASPEKVDATLLAPLDYKSFWASAKKPGYSGTVTYSKESPKNVKDLGIEEFDNEGRVQILTYSDFSLINTYFPNSQDKGKRLPYKEAFCHAILKACNSLRKEGKNVILCGDYNIAHKALDLTHPKANEGHAGYLPEERAWMDKYIAAGYIDTFRFFNKEGGNYTWWSYRTRAREKNVGWRLDYCCVNEEFKNDVKECRILNEVMGSDHCPVKLVIS